MKPTINEQAEWLSRTLVEILDATMKERGISRVELARRMEVRPSYITKLLSGSENLTIKTMVKMSEAIGCEVEISVHKGPVPKNKPIDPEMKNLKEIDLMKKYPELRKYATRATRYVSAGQGKQVKVQKRNLKVSKADKKVGKK